MQKDIKWFKSECWNMTFTFIIDKSCCETCDIARNVQKQTKYIVFNVK